MLSTSSIFQSIHNNPQAFRLLLSIAAKGEYQGGWENERIAELTTDAVLSGKIRRHGTDETKHGLMFTKLLQRAGLDTVPVPPDADYCKLLESKGMGLSHERLQQKQPLNESELLAYLVHSKVTEERAAEEVDRLLKVFRNDPTLAPTLSIIADDEVNHLAYCHEELLRLSAQGRRSEIAQLLEEYAQVEIRVYREVSLAFVKHMGDLMSWGKLLRGLLTLGVWASFWMESTLTWPRLVALRPPVRQNAMGEKPSAPNPYAARNKT